MELWQLQQLQGLPLEIKIKKTELRIREWYEHWDGDVYISFSGGKDSTVLLHIARSLYPDMEAVFVDTGLEYPEIRDFVKTFDNVTWLRPSKTFKQVINEYGYPIVSKQIANCVDGARKGQRSRIDKLKGDLKDKHGNKSIFNHEKWKFLYDAPFKISDKCCDVMKKQPIHKYEKESGKKSFIGMLAEESFLRKNNWLKNGCNAFNSKRPTSNPLSFWTEQDILQYILQNDLKIADCYGEIVKVDKRFRLIEHADNVDKLTTTKCKRTGCMFCMFGAHLEQEPNRFQMMKETHPKIWDYCIREENGLGIGKVLDFIDVKYE